MGAWNSQPIKGVGTLHREASSCTHNDAHTTIGSTNGGGCLHRDGRLLKTLLYAILYAATGNGLPADRQKSMFVCMARAFPTECT